MAATHQIPDLVRVQTIATALSNKALWVYVNHPDAVDVIAGILGNALLQIKDVAPDHDRTLRCPPGYCKTPDGCEPCEIDPPPPPLNKRAVRPSAEMEVGDGAGGPKAKRAGRASGKKSHNGGAGQRDRTSPRRV